MKEPRGPAESTSRPISRRALLQSASAVAVAGMVGSRSLASDRPVDKSEAFPDKFLWGCATAGHQVEGNNTNSDLWLIEHLPESIFKEPSGDACDHYHLYPQGISMLADLGFNTYRFSLEWARIEPEGRRILFARRAGALPAHAGCLPRASFDALTYLLTLQHATVVRV